MGSLTSLDGIEIYCKDCGLGQAIFLSHGWPLSADMLDAHRETHDMLANEGRALFGL